jgi:hypothetical protein
MIAAENSRKHYDNKGKQASNKRKQRYLIFSFINKEDTIEEEDAFQ